MAMYPIEPNVYGDSVNLHYWYINQGINMLCQFDLRYSQYSGKLECFHQERDCLGHIY